jgi:hypothetical protein
MKKINPCSGCGKPSEFFIVTDSRSVHMRMTWESVQWRCLDCTLKAYFPEWIGHGSDFAYGPGQNWIAHRAPPPSASRKQGRKRGNP